MRARVMPGGRVRGETTVPGDKSIAHRWLMLAATADGPCRLEGLPRSLDVRSTASCLAALSPALRPALEAWASSPPVTPERDGSTWNGGASTLDVDPLDLRPRGRGSLTSPSSDLDCGNSGTTMRLLAGLLAAAPFEATLRGDDSLTERPMERVAEPLRAMGAEVTTSDGHAPLAIRGSALHGIRFVPEVPSAQVKTAILLAGLAAEGTTTVTERVTTRDHTERLLDALGASVRVHGTEVTLDGPYQHGGFMGTVPGDPSAAAFVAGAVALTGGETSIVGLGLNPTRTSFLRVLERMGVRIEVEVEGRGLGEPVGSLRAAGVGSLRPASVGVDELPLVIDEVPLLAAVAAHADGETRFEGAGELRAKESDRLVALVDGIRDLGGDAAVDGDALVIGGGGLAGGNARSAGDHRIAMSLIVAALAARGPCEVDAVEASTVSFPGFLELLRGLGADVEVVG
ncbi:MAG TPA: 3-phosphoshikimate 1-carboxyvinyltransferase [Actinomycetota bacterium]|nr:3-phosphoshikimate 1-carboxyvinyltransferase [Actinomycetota bacterium]